MSRFFIKISPFLLVILLSTHSFAQNKSKAQLEREKRELSKQITLSNQLLKEAKKAKQKSSIEILLLNDKIETRQEKIATIRRQIRYIENKIAQKEELIAQKEKELEQLKDEYAKMIYYAYKNRSSYDKLMFIFSSEDFNQAYRRLKYFQQYSEYRKKQAELIVKTKEELNKNIAQLELQKSERKSLLNEESSEQKELLAEKQEQQNTISALQKKEKQIKAEIQKKEKEKAKLQQAIQRIIEEEIRKAKEAKSSIALTPEAKALSKSFANNKANLPWPVEKGRITGKFGRQPHPVVKTIEINNQGVDISTTKGSTARAVFDGTVSSVLIIPGVGKAVMVQHGEYFTIYSNLQETFVQKGDKIKTKQTLGTIITDESKGKTELHFEVRKLQNPQNPADWLFKAK